MASRSGPVPLNILRNALRQRVAETSLRATATEVGLSWKGIGNIINGTDPQPRTIRKLTDWYVRRGALSEEPSAETVQAALAVLTRGLPLGVQAKAVTMVIEGLHSTLDEDGLPVPEWLRRLGSE